MSIRNRLKGLAINAYLSDSVQRAGRQLDDLRRRAKKQPRQVEFYYEAADPYSHLLVQLLTRLHAEQSFEGAFFPVTPPASDMNPAPGLREVYSLEDARMLAKRYGLEFPEGNMSVAPGEVMRVNQVLIVERPFAEQLAAAYDLGAALWSADKSALSDALGTYGKDAAGSVAPALATNYARMRDRGHFTGGTIRYGGAWHMGVDRFQYLEAQLAQDSGVSAPSVLKRVEGVIGYEDLPAQEGGGPLVVELFFSFRSPYSYLALDRAFALAERHPIELRVRPVLPIKMRNLPVPKTKSMYLVKDSKREADRQGIPFGRICDPLGVGVERCLAVYRGAKTPEDANRFMLHAARAIWSEALDVADDGDLHTICDRAGITWADARASLSDDSWKKMVEENQEAQFVAGHWGVPAFRLGNVSMWGQDRMDVVEDLIVRYVEQHATELA